MHAAIISMQFMFISYASVFRRNLFIPRWSDTVSIFLNTLFLTTFLFTMNSLIRRGRGECIKADVSGAKGLGDRLPAGLKVTDALERSPDLLSLDFRFTRTALWYSQWQSTRPVKKSCSVRSRTRQNIQHVDTRHKKYMAQGADYVQKVRHSRDV